DIGSPAKYRQAQLDLMAGKVATSLRRSSAPDGRWIADDVTLEAAAEIIGPCVIGAGSRLDAGCRVGPGTVLGEGGIVGPGARVTAAILGDRVSVGAGAEVRDCIVGAGARIGAGAHVGPGAVIEAEQVVPVQARLGG